MRYVSPCRRRIFILVAVIVCLTASVVCFSCSETVLYENLNQLVLDYEAQLEPEDPPDDPPLDMGIRVLQGGSPIPDGSYIHDFGTVKSDADGGFVSAEVEFTIQNIGEETFTVTLEPLSGSDPGDFDIVSSPSGDPLDPGDSTPFTLRFDPLSRLTKTASVTLTVTEGGDFTFDCTGYGDYNDLDAVFLVDLSGSMLAYIATIKNELSDVYPVIIETHNPYSHMGVGTFCEFPSWAAGIVDEFELDLDLTDSGAAISAAVTGIPSPGGGGDMEGPHHAALWNSSQSYSWRVNSHRIIFMITDSPMHDHDSEPSYPEPGFTEMAMELLANNIILGGLGITTQPEFDLEQVAAAVGGAVQIITPDQIHTAVDDILDITYP